jgi:hypothetical protein
MTDIKVGDEVRVLPTRHTLRRQPQWRLSAEGYRGTVIRTGKKYATATYEYIWTVDGTETRRTGEIVFDMESGCQRGSNEFYVRTPEQLARTERLKTALFHLENVGVEVSSAARLLLTVEQIEALAEVAKTFTEQEG